MPLTKEQLKQIQDIIDRRFLSFSYETLGDVALTPAEIERLKRAGLLRSSVRNLTGDSYTVGKIVALVERSGVRNLSYENVLKIAKGMKPLTGIEKKAIEYAKEHAGQYIKGLRDNMVRDAGAMVSRARMTALRSVREGVSEAVSKRQSISQLKTELFSRIDDTSRDWQRVAHTEMNTTIQQAIYNDIREKSPEGENQRIYRRPNPSACEHCKRLYLEADGFTPKIFRLGDLQVSNVGRKARNWVPTQGSTHPWCFVSGHKILTKRGEIPIEFVKKGDKVFTHKARWKSVLRTSHRDWSGDLTVIHTKNSVIKSTPEHPYLRNSLWVPACKLDVGDNLFEVIPNQIMLKKINNKPVMSGKIREFIGIVRYFLRTRMPVPSMYFYRKIRFWYRDVNVVFKNGLKWFNFYSSIQKLFDKFLFNFRRNGIFFNIFGSLNERFNRRFTTFPFFSGIFSKFHSLFCGAIPTPNPCRLTLGPWVQFHFDQSCMNCPSTDIQFLTNPKYGMPSVEHFSQFTIVDDLSKHSFRNSVIVKKSKEKYSGKVFNLTVEDDGSFICNGIAVHNCNCQTMVVPDGYSFERRRTIVEPFGNKKRGQFISDEEYARLNEHEKAKVGWDAVLTGKTPRPSE